MRKSLSAVLIGIMILPCLVSGNQKPEPEKESRSKSVYAVVTKDGEFVKDLTKEDFQIFEDEKEIEISSFKMVTPRKQLLLIFHDPHFWTRNIQKEMNEITNELILLAQQGIEFMIFRLSWQRGLELLQDFTMQEELIREAARKAMENIGIYKSFEEQKGQIFYQGEDTKREELIELEQRAETQAALDIKRRRFEKALGGILAASNMMRDIEGRKSILLISNGIPELFASYQEQIRNIRIFDPINILKEKKFNRADEVLREIIRYVCQKNVSLYCLDPGIFTRSLFNQSAEIAHQDAEEIVKISSDERKKQIQNLRLLSEETGGVLFRGSNKFEEMQRFMSTDLAYSYRLSFKPTRKKADDQYHKLKVKVTGGGMDVRIKKGYTDYSEEEERKMMLVSAYYSPQFFKELPFEADFVPFLTEEEKYEPWINLALPTKELFRDKIAQQAKKTFQLHFWIKESGESERAFGGQINLPFDINSSFIDFINKTAYLLLFFAGKEISLSPNEYQAIFTLLDSQQNKIGTWGMYLSIPDFKENKDGALINCIIGTLSNLPEKRTASFTLNKKTGHLEYGQIRFTPLVTNKFSLLQDVAVFLQVYAPRGQDAVQPEFLVSWEGYQTQSIPGKLQAHSYNKKSKVWSGIYELNMFSVLIGENTFQVKIPLTSDKAIFSKEILLTKLQK